MESVQQQIFSGHHVSSEYSGKAKQCFIKESLDSSIDNHFLTFFFSKL